MKRENTVKERLKTLPPQRTIITKTILKTKTSCDGRLSGANNHKEKHFNKSKNSDAIHVSFHLVCVL